MRNYFLKHASIRFLLFNKSYVLGFTILSFILYSLLVLTLIILGKIDITYENIDGAIVLLIMSYAMLYPLSIILIKITKTIFKEFNNRYYEKAIIYAIYQYLIGFHSHEIARYFFLDTVEVNGLQAIVIFSLLLFLATEITYFPIRSIDRWRERKIENIKGNIISTVDEEPETINKQEEKE